MPEDLKVSTKPKLNFDLTTFIVYKLAVLKLLPNSCNETQQVNCSQNQCSTEPKRIFAISPS